MASEEATMRILLTQLSKSKFSVVEASNGKTSFRIRRRDNGAVKVRSGAKAIEAEIDDSKKEAMLSNALLSPRVGHFFPRLKKDGTRYFPDGAKVSKGEIYGMIEAMHLKYECKAENDGVVEKWLADMGEPVEYGQTLVVLTEV